MCVPHVGGSTSFFLPLLDGVARAIDVLAVEHTSPGELTDDRIGPLAAEIADALRPRIDRPVALFGHGTGALLAVAAGRFLERRAGIVPVALLLSGRSAPPPPAAGDDRLTCPILALACDADPTASIAGMDRWRRHTTGPFTLRVYPGGGQCLLGHRSEICGQIARELLPAEPAQPAQPGTPARCRDEDGGRFR
ncbi:thioesterase domain-containing protein [Actinomadura sp. OS1-43]|nr:thioesterase domain-containing protein [Actinomadura sp. OS1-43]MDL4815413.1 thioesterase domain-containing protein [Actinomadura sp. OS1-43]